MVYSDNTSAFRDLIAEGSSRPASPSRIRDSRSRDKGKGKEGDEVFLQEAYRIVSLRRCFPNQFKKKPKQIWAAWAMIWTIHEDFRLMDSTFTSNHSLPYSKPSENHTSPSPNHHFPVAHELKQVHQSMMGMIYLDGKEVRIYLIGRGMRLI
jgi:hypothetical protein